MTTHIGREGVIKVGGNAVGETLTWQLNVNVPMVPDTAAGDSWVTNKIGTKSWDGELVCMIDPDDTLGQEALEAAVDSGADITLELQPEGSTVGNKEYSGAAKLSAMGVVMGGNDVITERRFSFVGNGPLTFGTA